MSTIRTKKYKLEPSLYVKLAMQRLLRNPFKMDMAADERKQLFAKTWWFWLVVLGLFLMVPISLALGWSGWWAWLLGAVIVLVGGYLLFWYAQFVGITQTEQTRVLFEKMQYEIDSRQILMKISEKQGMPVPWDKVKEAEKTNEAFVMSLSKAQFIYLPFKIFNSEHDLRFMEVIMQRKNLLK